MSRPHVVRDPAPSDPRAVLVAAIHWAVEKGRYHVIASADPGIICTSTALGTWGRDPNAAGISPLGAAVLHAIAENRAPAIPDLDAVLTVVLGATKRWIEAFTIGLIGLRPQGAWDAHPSRDLLLHGYAVGKDLYSAAAMTSYRHHTGVRYPRNGACPKCAAEEADITKPDTRSEQQRAADSDPFLTPVNPDAGKWEV